MACSTSLRRFACAQAGELAILCGPNAPSPDLVHDTESVYRTLATVLGGERTSFRDLTAETLFLRDVRRDLPLVLDVRDRVLAEIGEAGCAPRPAFIGQAPIDGNANVAVMASAVIPRRRHAWSVRDVPVAVECTCDGCARSGARFVRLGDQTSVHTTNIYGSGDGAFAQALNMFALAARFLEQNGMGFHDVVRTWIHLRDIDRDYDALNLARREFFARCGIERRPASTGIQGIPFPTGHDCCLSLYAVTSSHRLDIRPMSTPLLNEAWSYGADFSRGCRVVEADRVALYISGTASLDETGSTVHAGEFDAQADRMLANIASLLDAQGASFGDVVSAVTYLKRPNDAARLRARYRDHGFDGFPIAVVKADICRPELLCETELVAALPRPHANA